MADRKNNSRAPSNDSRYVKTSADRARELAFIEEYNRKMRRKRALALRKKRAYYGSVFTLAAVGFLMFVAVFAAALLIGFRRAPEKLSYHLTETVPVEGQNKPKVKQYGIHERDGVRYVSLGEFAERLSCDLSGDVHVMTMRFDDGSFASFYLDSPLVSVNGEAHSLDGCAYYSTAKGSDVFVPLSFFEKCVSGMDFEPSRRGRQVSIAMKVEEGISPHPAFSGNQPIPSPFSGVFNPPRNTYLTDVNAYEMYIDPEDASPFLSIVSAAAPIDASFVPDDLTEVADTRGERERVRLRLFAAKALEAMFAELRACGYDDVSVTKGYVSFDEQQTLYANTLASFAALCPEDEARARTNAAVPPAGLCEDQLGLSVDIHNLPTASQAFESESAYRWLYAHCADFGFVIRYPKNKTELTGHSFEPYHLRFVGRTAAREMAENGWCLEEYASAKVKDASDEG